MCYFFSNCVISKTYVICEPPTQLWHDRDLYWHNFVTIWKKIRQRTHNTDTILSYVSNLPLLNIVYFSKVFFLLCQFSLTVWLIFSWKLCQKYVKTISKVCPGVTLHVSHLSTYAPTYTTYLTVSNTLLVADVTACSSQSDYGRLHKISNHCCSYIVQKYTFGSGSDLSTEVERMWVYSNKTCINVCARWAKPACLFVYLSLQSRIFLEL